MKPELTYDLLKQLYLDENKSSGQIAKELGYGKTWIVKTLRKYGLTNLKSSSDREKAKLHNMKETNLAIYGSISPLGNEEVKKKCAKTFIENYGVDHPTRSKEIRKKIQNTCKERYGSITPFGNKEIKEKSQLAYKSGEAQVKCRKTKSLNGSHNISKPEEIIFKWLIQKFPDTLKQYGQDLRYPHDCDFYIPQLDLFIEYNEHWTHYKEPYDPNNIEHQQWIRSMQDKGSEYQLYAIKIFTITDPKKRLDAKNNNLNFKELWNLKEAQEFIDSL